MFASFGLIYLFWWFLIYIVSWESKVGLTSYCCYFAKVLWSIFRPSFTWFINSVRQPWQHSLPGCYFFAGLSGWYILIYLHTFLIAPSVSFADYSLLSQNCQAYLPLKFQTHVSTSAFGFLKYTANSNVQKQIRTLPPSKFVRLLWLLQLMENIGFFFITKAKNHALLIVHLKSRPNSLQILWNNIFFSPFPLPLLSQS
jgi:hypothetical protein